MADERSFNWRLNAVHNLDFFARLDGVPANERRGRINALLERLDLFSAGDRVFGEFSTRMKQRLAVARALLKRPCAGAALWPTPGAGRLRRGLG